MAGRWRYRSRSRRWRKNDEEDEEKNPPVSASLPGNSFRFFERFPVFFKKLFPENSGQFRQDRLPFSRVPLPARECTAAKGGTGKGLRESTGGLESTEAISASDYLVFRTG